MISECLPKTSPIVLIILLSTLVRCILAASLELGNDEVYYFTYAVQPDWNHFDHPPLVGLFIRIFTLNLSWVNDFSMRMPSILGAAVSTWLIAKCGSFVKGEKAGVLAAILYSTSLYTSIISGLFILPDSVQLVFWLSAIYTMLRIFTDKVTDNGRLILMLGVWIGLATMCKVHGLFLWIAVFGYAVFYQKERLKDPRLYLSVCMTAIIISPILLWNVNNDFITWQFHSSRVGSKQHGINIKSFLTTTFGQIVYNNPVNIFIFILVLIKQPHSFKRPEMRLLLWCSVPIIFATSLISLFQTTLPHWSGPGFIALILISSACVKRNIRLPTFSLSRKKLVNASAGLVLFVVFFGVLLINFYPGILGKKSGLRLGSGDFTLDMYGWNQLQSEFKKIRATDILSGKMPSGSGLIVHKWFPAGHLYYYLATPMHFGIYGIGSIDDLHKFYWLNSLQADAAVPCSGYFITSSNDFTNPKIIYQCRFKSIELAGKVAGTRSGKLVRYWYIYRLKGFTN